jgi:hypothetical protein
MNYIIFANNNTIKNYDILNLINNDTILVTLNHGLPLEQILSYNLKIKIYHFLRRSFDKKIPYSGLNIANNYKDKLDKLFLYPHPSSVSDPNIKHKIFSYIKNHTSLDIKNINHMIGFNDHKYTKEARSFLSKRYNGITNLSMGLISYLYIKQVKEDYSTIKLVNFTHSMNINKHNADAEKDFFQNEKNKGLCELIKLKS